MKVKSDHRSKFSHFSDWKEEAWKKSGPQWDSNKYTILTFLSAANKYTILTFPSAANKYTPLTLLAAANKLLAAANKL